MTERSDTGPTELFAALKYQLAHERGGRAAVPSQTLASLQNSWDFIADSRAPVELIVRLLDHAARTFPGREMRYTELTALTFSLAREPGRGDAHVIEVRQYLRRADRRLYALHERRIIRLGTCLRASIDQEDWRAFSQPRAKRRFESATRSFIRAARIINPSELSPRRHAEYFASLRECPLEGVTDPDDRAWLEAMLRCADGHPPN